MTKHNTIDDCQEQPFLRGIKLAERRENMQKNKIWADEITAMGVIKQRKKG